MAEESTDSFVTPERNELDGRIISRNSAGNSGSLKNGHNTHAHHRRASIGSYRSGDGLTRNSTEKSDSPNRIQNVVPHYLRASTGSCHDFCKYGRKHSFEEKARKPLRKRIPKPLPNELDPVHMVISDEQKKEKVVNHKPPTDGQNLSPDLKLSPDPNSYSPDPKTSLKKGKAVKQKSLTSTKSHSPELKPSPDTKSFSQKPKTSSDVKTYMAKQNASSGRKTLLPKIKPSSSKKFPSPDPPEIIKSVVFPSEEVEVPAEPASSTDNKISRVEKKTTYPSKQHSAPVKSKPAKVKPPSSSDNSDGRHGKGRRKSDAETGRDITASKASGKKVLSPPAATLSPEISPFKTPSIKSRKSGKLKLMSPLKDQNQIRKVKTKTSNNEKVTEKTLNVIEKETENNVLESIPDDHAVSSRPSSSSAESLCHAKSSSLPGHEQDNEETEDSVSEADELALSSDDGESLETGKVPPVKENQTKTLRKNRVVVSENKYSSPVKSKFRSGKAVDLQSDNNGPRRLRFRRARVLGAEESKGDLRRRTFKKTGVKDDATGVHVSSEKVVLKHQDVQGKKDAQGLLNNVIEQTASKLVESRKSKVKALVGAFETVISLQESKPCSQTVTCVE